MAGGVRRLFRKAIGRTTPKPKPKPDFTKKETEFLKKAQKSNAPRLVKKKIKPKRSGPRKKLKDKGKQKATIKSGPIAPGGRPTSVAHEEAAIVQFMRKNRKAPGLTPAQRKEFRKRAAKIIKRVRGQSKDLDKVNNRNMKRIMDDIGAKKKRQSIKPVKGGKTNGKKK